MPEDPVIARMRLALELHDLGVRMYAQRIRRENPGIDEDDVNRRVQEWLGQRPFDGPGTPRPRDLPAA